MLGLITPHVVIEGRPKLTQWVWDQCPGQRPIILSSQPLRSQVYHDDVQANNGPTNVYCFFGILCIPEVRALFPEFDFIGQLRSIFDEARHRFGLGSSEKLNVVAAGSHGSLWTHEHASVGRLANPFEFDAERGKKEEVVFISAEEGAQREAEALRLDAAEERSLKALRLLLQSAENRGFVGDIAKTLEAVGGVELRWLRECFPGLGAFDRSDDDVLREAANYSRRFMGDGYGAALGAALPQIYVRENDQYKLFARYDSHDAIEEVRAPTNPLRTTYLLLQQFADLRQRSPEDPTLASPAHDGSKVEQRVATFDPANWKEVTLTKLIPRNLVHGNLNPLDNPIIGENQYDAATDAGLTSILIDDLRGVLDLRSTFRRIQALAPGKIPTLTAADAAIAIKDLIGLVAISIRDSAPLLDYEEQRKFDRAPDKGHVTRVREVLNGLLELSVSILANGLFDCLEHAEETRVVDAYEELIDYLEAIRRHLFAMLGLKAPPTLVVGPIIRDLSSLKLGSALLIAHLCRLFPELSASVEDTLAQIRLPDLAADLFPPKLYRM